MRTKDPFSQWQVAEDFVRKNPDLPSKQIYIYFDKIGIKRTNMASYLSQIKRKIKEDLVS